MKCTLSLLVLVAFLATLSEAGQSKQVPTPPPSGDDAEKQACMNSIMNNMMTCLDYMQVGGAEQRPDKACCTGSQVVIKQDPKCICMALVDAPKYGYTLNATRANTLASVCHFAEPPALKQCLAAAMNTPSTPSPPASSPVPSKGKGGKGGKGTVPAPAPQKASSSMISVSYALMAIVGLVALSI